MIVKLRPKHSLGVLLSVVGLARSTYYYHAKRQTKPDKYSEVKEAITAIYHEHKGRYGYRRITTALRQRDFIINHKTAQRLMKELGLVVNFLNKSVERRRRYAK